MARRQGPEHRDEIPYSLIGSTDASPSAEFLQHIDAGPSVRRIHHQMHGSVRFEHASQGCESGIRVREMMENSGADNLVEGLLQFAYAIDGKLMDLKIGQVIFALERLRPLHTRRADVDAGDLSCRPAQRMLCRLGCSAAGNENGIVFLVGPAGPKEVIIRAALSLVLPCPSILIQAFDRRRIGIAVVEVLDLLCYIKRTASCIVLVGSWQMLHEKIPRQMIVCRGNLSIKLSRRGGPVGLPLAGC